MTDPNSSFPRSVWSVSLGHNQEVVGLRSVPASFPASNVGDDVEV